MTHTTDPTSDTIDPAFEALFELFDGPLKGISFPEVDRTILAELAGSVRESADRVASAEAALESARVALEERQLALLARCQRALAYARVYADENEVLQREVERIALPRGIATKPLPLPRERREHALTAGEPPRTRGRPRKHAEAANHLFPSATEVFPGGPVEPANGTA
jgi:hypothetical protein